jgi:hypothetical protein
MNSKLRLATMTPAIAPLTTQGSASFAINLYRTASLKPRRCEDLALQIRMGPHSIIGGREFNKNHRSDFSGNGELLPVYRVTERRVDHCR